VGFLNLDGAALAAKAASELAANGYAMNIAGSSRGDTLLRGNDVLAGTVDVLVCDSWTGNAIVKILAAFSTGGRIEVAGSGYGPGVGEGAPAVGIISRATAAPVVANAILLMAKMARAGLPRIYAEEKRRAEKAGLTALLAGLKDRSSGQETGARKGLRAPSRPQASAQPQVPVGAGPARKVVHHEIDGVDVLEIDAAVKLLLSKGIYCEAAMGCTGPVVLVAAEDATAAGGHLKSARYI
jgi:hypothetical protein